MALDGHPKWLTDVRVNVCKRPRKRPRKSLQTLEKCTAAFVKVLQTKGFESLRKTIEYIHYDQFLIADAKRSYIFNSVPTLTYSGLLLG